MQNFKKMCKNLPILNLPNEENNLILKTYANNEHWSAILKIKKGEKLCKYCNGSFTKVDLQLFYDGKGNPCSYKRN